MPSSCGVADTAARELMCRDSIAATHVKLVSILVILLTSVVGISCPVIVAKSFQGKPVYDKAILVIKCFAAGVILSTSLVHVLPDAFQALADCAVSTSHPWKDFPFTGLVTLLGALLALLVDLTANSSHNHNHNHAPTAYAPIDKMMKGVVVLVDEDNSKGSTVGQHEHVHEEDDEEEGIAEKMRQRMVSQVLEIGIIFHSVIIGVTMGMTQNVCTIKPLVAALSFHQIFEGMGLGGCIAQAGFSLRTTAFMCFMFSVTTPVGIVLGMLIFSLTGYDDSSANALIMEGLLGSLSSGILIYMALVDLISADFFHNKLMSSEPSMKKGCFVALVLGSTSMSILALWA